MKISYHVISSPIQPQNPRPSEARWRPLQELHDCAVIYSLKCPHVRMLFIIILCNSSHQRTSDRRSPGRDPFGLFWIALMWTMFMGQEQPADVNSLCLVNGFTESWVITNNCEYRANNIFPAFLTIWWDLSCSILLSCSADLTSGPWGIAKFLSLLK